MKTYEYRHVVGLEETNVVGNVYFANHFSWQGRCREMFLRDHAPDILGRLGKDVCLMTLRCNCDFLVELGPMDEVVIRMHLGAIVQNRMTVHFDHYRVKNGSEELVARGIQEIAAMRRDGDRVVARPIPESLREALRAYE